ncbi:3-methyl-2-oxobutanoate hydroxymethyltransferase [Longimicrobium sp.]|uniref:3-methyl-2-oxobutanoate hydroxymethyltransferase n=1 Tax=Longimicrobium sp. TaxID=2029185 RepID=UPI002E2EEA1B|nr:3-methyl-2-oxobutanoate hydroxymethyltransferase [Longimicrobium sp.]HEX6039084.1 3-methyl-2-oxobutanoate hydroxymethyltransferase [Longimicrobium sp.]
MSTQRGGGARRLAATDLREMKRRGDKIAAITAYDFLFARLVDAAGVDVVLVGDSLGHVIQGLDTTLPVTLDDMIYHARAVRRGVERALLVVDLPFLTYQISREDALRNAGRVLRESGASAVKLEGGSPDTCAIVRALVDAGIPVMGHLGFTPQSVNQLGVRVQAREEAAADRLVEDAKRLEEAGAFSVVLELVPGTVAERVTAALSIPTIGIGAGAGCDGQVLVLHDMLGLNPGFTPRFLRIFADVGQVAGDGVREYVRTVKAGEYPAAEHTF